MRIGSGTYEDAKEEEADGGEGWPDECRRDRGRLIGCE